MRSSRVRPSREAGEEAADAVVEGRLGVDGPELIFIVLIIYVLAFALHVCLNTEKRMQYQANQQGMHVIDNSFGQVLPLRFGEFSLL